jgi:hypothetical protein
LAEEVSGFIWGDDSTELSLDQEQTWLAVNIIFFAVSEHLPQ